MKWTLIEARWNQLAEQARRLASSKPALHLSRVATTRSRAALAYGTPVRPNAERSRRSASEVQGLESSEAATAHCSTST